MYCPTSRALEPRLVAAGRSLLHRDPLRVQPRPTTRASAFRKLDEVTSLSMASRTRAPLAALDIRPSRGRGLRHRPDRPPHHLLQNLRYPDQLIQ